MKKIVALLVILLCFISSFVPCTAASQETVTLLEPEEVRQIFNTSQNSVKDTYVSIGGAQLPYRLYVPDGYDPSKSYPLVLSFHGAGERGTDNEAQLSNASIWGRLLIESERENNPCLILAPQCPATSKWVMVRNWSDCVYNRTSISDSPYMRATEELLEKVLEEYSVDEGRLYVTGVSMGGYATWDIITRNPDKFAAAIPVCGGVDPIRIPNVKHLPIWTFHNDADPTVPPTGTRQAYELLKDYGNIKYNEFVSNKHNAWTAAFSTVGLTDWLFSKVNTVEVSYPTVTGASVTGPTEIHRNEKLTFNFTLEDGYALKSLTVGGTKVSYTETANGGTVEISRYAGAQIKLDVRKIVTLSSEIKCDTGSGGTVTMKESALAGETVSFTVKADEGYEVKSVKINGEAVELTGGSYFFIASGAAATVEVTFAEKASAPVTPDEPNEPNEPNEPDEPDEPTGGADFTLDESIIIPAAIIGGFILLLIVAILIFKRT